MNIIKKVIKNIIREFKPVYTQVVTDVPDEQYYEYKCYKNDKYTHTVNMHYFTTEQINKFKDIQEQISTQQEETLKKKIQNIKNNNHYEN